MSSYFDFTKFRSNLRELLSSHGKTAIELSSDVNISDVTISRYLNGKRDPELRYILILAEYFNVSVDWLLGISRDRFGYLPPDAEDISSLYCLASPDDRRVVQAVLNKYRKES